MRHIGVAETGPHGADGRYDRYRIYAATDTTLTVEYAGYRIGTTTWGVPLGGPGWSPPVLFTFKRDGFVNVDVFAERSETAQP